MKTQNNLRIRKIAQAPASPMPMPPPGPLSPTAAPPTGMPGMPPPGPMPTQNAAAPGMPGANPGREEIGSPLDTLSKVLYDVDVSAMIDNSPATDPSDLALKIWMLYGGLKDGSADKTKIGERDPNLQNVTPQAEEQEEKATENCRWKRLPQNSSISDITSLNELNQLMYGMVASTVKNIAKSNAAPAGGAGAPPGGPPGGPMASSAKVNIRLAQMLDFDGMFKQADYLDKISIIKLR